MKGQWLGSYNSKNLKGESSGKITLNIDELNNTYRGVMYIVPPDLKTLPVAVAYFDTKNKNVNQSIIINAHPINPNSGLRLKWDDIKKDYPKDTLFSNKITAEIIFKNNTLKINALTEDGIDIQTELKLPNHTEKSRIPGKKMSWDKFKLHVVNLQKDTYFFRGQKEPWKLQTSFHRRGRYCLDNYISSDVPKLHKRLSSLTQHYFDLTIPDQNGAFINLLQHHGYPTPLLDWSHSPFVSAFFAFRGWPIEYSGNEYIRVYIFNSKEWQRLQQLQIINPPYPHLSIMDFISINNPRSVPQQAITTVTNLSDIEHYLLDKGNEFNVDFIDAIDIPANERENAMSDLRYMGITAGSMFPGLDGACEEMREKYFKK